MTERAPTPSEVENRFHASSPDSMYTGKCGVGLGRITPKTSENTPRYRIGFSIDQATPRMEDLYLTFTSLRIRFHRIWRAPRISRKRGTTWSRGGSDVRTTTLALVVAMSFLWFLRGRCGHSAARSRR